MHVSNSMVEGPTLKLTVAQLVMEFLFFFWTPEVRCFLLLICILAHINLVNAVPQYLFEFLFNVILVGLPSALFRADFP